MAGGFSAIDLSQLPSPDVVQSLEYEARLAAMLADLRARAPDFDALLESDPAFILLELASYFKVLTLQRVNDAARAVMQPCVSKTDTGFLYLRQTQELPRDDVLVSTSCAQDFHNPFDREHLCAFPADWQQRGDVCDIGPEVFTQGVDTQSALVDGPD